MAETMYGYVRVSTREQNEDRQMLAMERFGVERRNIFLDKQSGQDFNRPRYRGLLRRMREGDVLVIKSIDRLGRNYEEILEQWRGAASPGKRKRLSWCWICRCSTRDRAAA